MSKYQYPLTARLIREARLRSGLNQNEFIAANNLDVNQATFSRWETGKAQVPANILFELGLVGEVITL